jgi:hypothetical protein
MTADLDQGGNAFNDDTGNNEVEIDDDLEVAGDTDIEDDLDLEGANIWFIELTDDIDATIAAAAAGDTIVLAAGTYTITADIDVTKSVSIVGQGRYVTVIQTTTDSINVFHVTASNVNIRDLSVDVTASTTYGFLVDGGAGTVLDDVIIQDVDVTLNSHAGGQSAIWVGDASGEIRDVLVYVESLDATAYGVTHENQVSAEAATTLNCYNVYVYCNAHSVSAAGFHSNDNGATSDNSMYLYNCTCDVDEGSPLTSYGMVANAGDAYLYAENCVADAVDNDFANINTAGGVQLRDCTAVNGTLLGTITLDGRVCTDDVRINSGAANNYVLTSDANGVGTWQEATLAGVGIDLGVNTDGVPLTYDNTAGVWTNDWTRAYAFRAHLPTNITLASGVSTRVPLSTETVDTHDIYDTNAYLGIFPVIGVWDVGYNLYASDLDASQYMNAYLYHASGATTTLVSYSDNQAGANNQHYSMAASTVIDVLTTNDLIYLNAYANGTKPIGGDVVQGRTYITGHYVGRTD